MPSVPLSLEKGNNHLTFVKKTKKKHMEIVNIEAATFQKMKMTLQNFSPRIRQIVGKASAKNTDEW